MAEKTERHPTDAAFWSLSEDDLQRSLGTTPAGLSTEEASRRREVYGANAVAKKKKSAPWKLFLAQFRSPILLMLIFASAVSAVLHDYVDAVIIVTIIAISAALGFSQEYHAGLAVSRLLEMVSVKVSVRRGGEIRVIPVEDVVPGDVILVKNGSVVPADCRLIESNHLRVDESGLTGESIAVEKMPDVLPESTGLAARLNVLWMGTHVVGGSGEAVVVHTGLETEFGKISAHLQQREPMSEFEQGIRKFGNLLMQMTIFILLVILLVNDVMGKPFFDAFLFSLALAVGMTPQLLPAIVSVNLAYGAKEMARKRVIVKKLASIQDFGSMDVLCSDKTGTVTTGKIGLEMAMDVRGEPSDLVRTLGLVNATFQSAYDNPMDDAICAAVQEDISGFSKRGEIPYNFSDKTLSVLVQTPSDGYFSGETICITKGAVDRVLECCAYTIGKDKTILSIEQEMAQIRGRFEALGRRGMRVVGVAYREVDAEDFAAGKTKDMVFAGFLAFFDPLKPGVEEATRALSEVGVRLKIISGDNRFAAGYIAEQLHLNANAIATGEEISQLSDAALERRVEEVDVFAEIEPNQKERIVLALRRFGHVVGFMGDGINDASAIHVADVGISVDTAADVAKEEANIVLLEQDLRVLAEGILAGRKTFANTLKYIFMATSANFGNMFSMAGASLILPFLPLRSTQVLLTNLLTDLPEMQIATDAVDERQLMRPQRWNIKNIRKFMLVFGPLSSLFDYATFGVLMWGYHASESLFQTAWFVESILSACLVVFVVRTPSPFFRSRPGKGLRWASAAVILLTLALPFTPLASSLGFVPYPPALLAVILGLVVAYMTSAELVKRLFYRWVDMGTR